MKAEGLVEYSQVGYVLFMDIASGFTTTGINRQALDWLERGFEVHDPNLPYIPVFPTFYNLHGEARFQDLLKRMNYPEDVLARLLGK